jgi:uncharacterized protein YggU (UPF0235/DUF167 family)
MYIHVKARTKQKKEYIKELKEGYYEVSVREKPEKNLANKRILSIIKEKFRKSNVKIVSGHKSNNKLRSVE